MGRGGREKVCAFEICAGRIEFGLFIAGEMGEEGGDDNG